MEPKLIASEDEQALTQMKTPVLGTMISFAPTNEKVPGPDKDINEPGVESLSLVNR